MAQECGFFNAKQTGDNEYDRVYLAEQFAAYFASFIGNGVFGKSMQKLEVKAQSPADMSVKVLPGEAWINGWWYRNNDDYMLNLDIADGALDRIDLIVLRWGNVERDMWLDVIKGVPSYDPVKPELKRGIDYYDLQLATVEVSKGSLVIAQSAINDTRLDNSVCGLVTGVIDQIDTTGLYDQFNQAFLELQDSEGGKFAEWLNKQMSIYLAWFADIQDKLGDDPATSLQEQILQLQKKHANKLVADIKHDLHAYPECTLFETSYVVGTQGAGIGPCGGGSLFSVPVETEMVGMNQIKVWSKDDYEEVEEVIKVKPLEYAIMFKNNTTRSLYCILDDRVSRSNDYLQDYYVLSDNIEQINDRIKTLDQTLLDNLNNFSSVSNTPIVGNAGSSNRNPAGWYRIATLGGGINVVNTCIVSLERLYNSPAPEYQRFQVFSVYDVKKIVSLAACSKMHLWTKARVVKDTVNNCVYIEIYQNSESYENRWNIFILEAKGVSKGGDWVAMRPLVVSETGVGLEVVASLDLPADK